MADISFGRFSVTARQVKRPVKLRAKISTIIWEEPSGREKVVLFGKYLLHAHQIPGKVVFPRNYVHARVVVDFLIGEHLG